MKCKSCKINKDCEIKANSRNFVKMLKEGGVSSIKLSGDCSKFIAKEGFKILIVDIETTGLNPKDSSIVEVGIVSLDLITGEKEILFDKMVNGGYSKIDQVADSWIVKNKYIEAYEIIKSDPFWNYKEEIQYIIDFFPNGITAFNNAFDFKFLEAEGIVLEKKLGCPMKIATNICQIPNKRGGFKWPNVEEAYSFFFPNSDFVEKHRGADDAFHEADIVKALYDRGDFSI